MRTSLDVFNGTPLGVESPSLAAESALPRFHLRAESQLSHAAARGRPPV